MILSLDIVYAQTNVTSTVPSDENSLIIMVNLERIRNQILLAEKSLASGDTDMAFAHSYIPHSVIFPSIKDQLTAINSKAGSQLESLLTDLPISIRTGHNEQEQRHLIADLRSIEQLLDNISNQTIGQHLLSNRNFIANTIVYLLRDAEQSYSLSNATTNTNQQFSKVDYENAQGLINISKSNYEKIAGSIDERRRQEIDSFFVQLENSIRQRNNVDEISQFAAAIERDLIEYLSIGIVNQGASPTIGEHSQYFTTIRNLMSDVVNEVKQNGDYRQADKAAMTAYLDNYEYLEAPIERLNATLMEVIEIDMREELRDMLKEEQPIAAVESFVNGILVKLSTAEELLNNDASISSQNQVTSTTGQSRPGFADIEGLSQGFGTYTGERRQMGEADDPSKAAVRSDIDQIRIKLDESLNLYRQGEVQEALTTARSAYLDSYEKVEIPLRPIDPDFTLDMEIKFAELRNLIQSNAEYEAVLKKTSEIKSGLDESERLVSGTGIIAPSIAFSTSFSIIFREGLESALIIGAIITYLEASRNQRFKKHVYYGIIVAVAATAVTWFIARYIIEISGASRELIEAIAGISAVAVLFWVSFWVLNKIETKRWIEFVKAKVWKATTTGSVLVFVMLSFFTVYREGFETVLFYQAILGFARYMEWYVIAGMVLGLAVIIGVAIGVRKLGRKLPLRVLFGLTMAIGAYMSIAFMGNAIREFQEVGYIPTTHLIGTIPRLDINLATITGIHPTLETIVAQLILLSVYIIGSLYILILQPRKKRAIETSRKSMADLEKKGSTSADKY
ncbi:MAG: FTR1 family iron permease [Thermoproteota archaeon]|nr:FTR1 family iron permease [Thermoproteota archaeon]